MNKERKPPTRLFAKKKYDSWDHTILLFPKVANELEFDAEQSKRWPETRRKIKALVGRPGLKPPPTVESIPEELEANVATHVADFARHLKPQQTLRLREIQLQAEGPIA